MRLVKRRFVEKARLLPTEYFGAEVAADRVD